MLCCDTYVCIYMYIYNIDKQIDRYLYLSIYLSICLYVNIYIYTVSLDFNPNRHTSSQYACYISIKHPMILQVNVLSLLLFDIIFRYLRISLCNISFDFYRKYEAFLFQTQKVLPSKYQKSLTEIFEVKPHRKLVANIIEKRLLQQLLVTLLKYHRELCLFLENRIFCFL